MTKKLSYKPIHCGCTAGSQSLIVLMHSVSLIMWRGELRIFSKIHARVLKLYDFMSKRGILVQGLAVNSYILKQRVKYALSERVICQKQEGT